MLALLAKAGSRRGWRQPHRHTSGRHKVTKGGTPRLLVRPTEQTPLPAAPVPMARVSALRQESCCDPVGSVCLVSDPISWHAAPQSRGLSGVTVSLPRGAGGWGRGTSTGGGCSGALLLTCPVLSGLQRPHAHMHANACAHTSMNNMDTHECTCACARTRGHNAHAHVFSHVHMHAHTCPHTHTDACTHTCTPVHTCPTTTTLAAGSQETPFLPIPLHIPGLRVVWPTQPATGHTQWRDWGGDPPGWNPKPGTRAPSPSFEPGHCPPTYSSSKGCSLGGDLQPLPRPPDPSVWAWRSRSRPRRAPDCGCVLGRDQQPAPTEGQRAAFQHCGHTTPAAGGSHQGPREGRVAVARANKNRLQAANPSCLCA